MDGELLSRCRPLAPLRPGHDAVIVQHAETLKLYVQKTLPASCAPLYRTLKNEAFPGIPRVFDLAEEEDTLTVLEQYVPGDTLQETVERDGPLPPERVRDLAVKLCEILRPLHRFSPPIVHRDIKADNLILTPSNELMLLDFDAARLSEKGRERDTVLLGTQGYAAPEQYGFGPSTPKADIYAIGILMRYLLTGSVTGDCSAFPKLNRVIARCVQLAPEKRFSSVDALQRALGGSHADPAARSWLPPGFRRKHPLHMFLAAPSYIFMLYIALTLEVENESIHMLIEERILCALLFIGLVFCIFNYRGCHRFFPFHDHPNAVLRWIGVALGCAIYFSVIMMVMILIEVTFFGA